MRLLLRIVVGLGLAAAAVVVALLAGAGWLYHEGHRKPPGNAGYVALGSSFAAAPGVGERAPQSPTLCMRSAEDYPHLLARKRNLALADMTCSGATTAHVLRGGQYFQGPQIDALTPDTRLVTVTIGGNDVLYLDSLFAFSCRNDTAPIGWIWRVLICKTPPPRDMVYRNLGKLGGALRDIAQAVHERAPLARLVFVDYATILPDTGDCPDRLPVGDEELERVRLIADQLAHVTAAVAQQTGALLVPASQVTHSHHVCADDPWIFAWTMPRTPLNFAPVAYHPTQNGMAAIARAVDDALDR